ncbi:hypothetical protein Landi51_00602 [Colletotrichum acutatum]
MSRPNDAQADADDAAVACAENISLLFLLNKLQHMSEPNRPVPQPAEEEERMLPFCRERSLCGALAFLASIDGNPDFIPAVYIEELTKSQQLEVVVAVNKESPRDGEGVLKQIRRGFEQIFSQLEGLDGKLEMCLLRAESKADSMVDRLREPRRMRINIPEESGIEEGTEEGKPRAHLRPTRQRHSIERLLTTFDAYFKDRLHLSSLRTFRDSLKELLKRAHNVTQSLRKWKSYQKSLALQPLVEEVFQLSRVGQFEQLVHMIPHTTMDPGLKTSLCNMIPKIARYREIARHIYRTAKKYHIARRVEVVIVNLASSEPGAYERVSEGSRYPELNKALSRNEIKALPDRKLRSIWKNAHSPSKDVKHVFENKTSNTLKSAKVHAEVQLIYHYHLKSRHSDLPPRVIRSSKDACYLCNAFIKAEKTFYTSRCHGRLYPSWKLPRVVSRLDLAQRFNELLKGRIISAYGDLAGFRANCPKADPAESTISTLNWSVSTEAEEPSVTTVPGAINVVIVTTEKETENQEVPQDLEAQNDFVENKNMIQEEPQEGNQNGQQESTSGLIVSDAEEIPNKGSQPDEPVESRIHIEQKEEERETLQGQAAEDSIATTVVGQDDEARTTEASPGRRNAAPVQEDRTPRISPAIRISHGTRIQSQSPDRRSKPRRKQRPIRIRTSYAVIRKTYCPEGVSIKNTVYSIEETAVYSNDGEIETKKRTFPLAREGNKVLQERMLPARIRIMMNILANV